ncbi:MAG: hypothetical protein AAFO93_05110 [Pseudomonadota bacterium]
MASYNTQFTLNVDDLALIEDALRARKSELCQAQLTSDGETTAALDAEAKEVAGLLGRLHNQKVFYRPKSGVYVGG